MIVQTLRIIAILVLAWLLQAVAARLIRLFRAYMVGRTGPDESAAPGCPYWYEPMDCGSLTPDGGPAAARPNS